MNCLIRPENKSDYRLVEEITRKAFWNLHIPGCDEHYLVHIMRQHEDFIHELNFVIEHAGSVIGNIMFTRAKLVSESGIEKGIITFGPVSILPEFQRKGFGKTLIYYALNAAVDLGYDFVAIFGNPSNYVSLGFESSSKYNVGICNGIYPSAFLVKELKKKSLDRTQKWNYIQSEVYTIDPKKAEEFDRGFPEMEKKTKPCQESYYIMSNSRIIME